MEKYKFGYVRGKSVVVFNDPKHSFPVFGSRVLEGIEVEIKGNGTLRVIGTEICCDLYLQKTAESEWENEPEESEVKVRKVGILWKRHEERYLEGWVFTKKRVPFDIEFGSGWSLERKE